MEKRTRARHTATGGEILDPTPLQPPLGYKRTPTLAEQIRQQVLAAKLAALDELEETEEEADDFEVGDDFEPLSPHENENAPTLKELRARAAHINNEIKKRNIEKLTAELEAKHESMKAAARAKPAQQPSSEETE